MTARTVVVIAALAGGIAVAAPAPAPAVPTLADWVGDFNGALAWRSCTAPGLAKPTIRIEAVRGFLYVDLTAAGGGLQRMMLTEEKRTLVAQDGDVKVAIARPRADAIDLVVELDSGCTITGRLARATSGVAACDRLTAWARVEASCGVVPVPHREDPVALAKRVWTAADAPACTARADRLEHRLLEEGCVPLWEPLVAKACLALEQSAQRLARCGALPRELVEPIVARAGSLRVASMTALPATLPVVDAQCTEVQIQVDALSARFRCTP
ncbi:MAG: hypothetical protein KIT31_22140 [Deltaproteobacteria bacterium]|nr:hypothetical protein [Deltaproteobacteria bacterium]